MMTVPSSPVRTAGDLRGRRTVVLGLARSGVAASRFLADAGAVVVAYDRRPAGELADAVAALGARPVDLALGVDEAAAAALLEHADLLITSPSVSSRFPTTDPWLREALVAAEARGAEVVSEVELFLRLTRARILAVTGTKGKTTTASLVAAILDRAGMPNVLGGNIGTPLVERSSELGPDTWAVLELSELQLPTITRGADVALYTNVAEDHLDRHGSVEAYRAVKARLAELTAPAGRVVLNDDDPGCRALGERLPPASVAWYGIAEPRRGRTEAWVDDDGWLRLAGEQVFDAREVPLPGRHMLSNVLCASLGALLAGAPQRAIGEAIRAFTGVPHRLELVAARRGVRWVNDSQATIPMAAIAALKAFEAPIVLIAGGKDKGLAYGTFADAIAARCRAVVLIGETAGELAALIGDRVPIERASGMPEAVRAAAALARPGDVALLSPAAASFDMFVDYAARGDAFRAAVMSLGDGSGDAR
jgi:UDP-N-acetylmuramoylalanine--D-glutamate ligase